MIDNGVTTVTKRVTETIVEDGVETINVYIYVNDKLGEYLTCLRMPLKKFVAVQKTTKKKCDHDDNV